MDRTFTAAVHQEDGWYVARCLEIDVASQGPDIDQALRNLAEAVELYLAEADEVHPTATPLITHFRVPRVEA